MEEESWDMLRSTHYVNRRLRSRIIAIAITGLATMLVAGCGDDSSSGSSGGKKVSATPPASGCGSFDLPAVRDPSGAAAALPKAQRDALTSLSVDKSKWANFKPKGDPPYTVGIVWTAPVNDFIIQLLENVKSDLKKTGIVGDVPTTIAGDAVNVPLQIQQMRAMIEKSPDAILTLPLQPEAFVAVTEKAASKNIPVMSFFGTVPSASAINMDANAALGAARVTSNVVRSLGGKGSVVTVEGILSTTVNNQTMEGVKAVLKNCPDIKNLGTAVGSFSNAAAKAGLSKFLATHPQKVDGVVQFGGMGPGVIEAFQTGGRPVPLIGDIGVSKGSLAYWRDNRANYPGTGTGQSAAGSSQAIAEALKRLLSGGGPKVNALVPSVVMVTDSNLDDWVEDSWTIKTPGLADGPPGSFMSSEFMGPFFNNQTD